MFNCIRDHSPIIERLIQVAVVVDRYGISGDGSRCAAPLHTTPFVLRDCVVDHVPHRIVVEHLVIIISKQVVVLNHKSGTVLDADAFTPIL